MNKQSRAVLGLILACVLASIGLVRVAAAATAAEIDTRVDTALAEFKEQVPGGAEFLAKANGVLVFPKIIKAGLVVGGEYGEGALRIGGKSVQYYNIASASLGLQVGAQEYTIVMVFLNGEALQKFRDSQGWEAGVDGSVAIAKWGAGEDINTQSFKEPIVGFVYGNKGLMAGISIEGSKITKLEK